MHHDEKYLLILSNKFYFLKKKNTKLNMAAMRLTRNQVGDQCTGKHAHQDFAV